MPELPAIEVTDKAKDRLRAALAQAQTHDARARFVRIDVGVG